MRQTRTRRNPTQADVIATMLAKAVTDAQTAVQAAVVGRNQEEIIDARARRNALSSFKDRVDRYIAGDLSAIY